MENEKLEDKEYTVDLKMRIVLEKRRKKDLICIEKRRIIDVINLEKRRR